MFTKDSPIINFTTDDIKFKFELFSKKIFNNTYLTGIIQLDWLHMLDAYWDEKYMPCSDDFISWPHWLYQYFNELPLGESIESSYLK